MPTPHALAWGGSTGPPDISFSGFACLAARRPEPKRFCSQDHDAVFEAEDGRRAQPIRRGHQTQAKDGRCLAPTRPFDRTPTFRSISLFFRVQAAAIDLNPKHVSLHLDCRPRKSVAAGRRRRAFSRGCPASRGPDASGRPKPNFRRLFIHGSNRIALLWTFFRTLQRRSAMRVGECGARASGGSLRLAGTSLTTGLRLVLAQALTEVLLAGKRGLRPCGDERRCGW